MNAQKFELLMGGIGLIFLLWIRRTRLLTTTQVRIYRWVGLFVLGGILSIGLIIIESEPGDFKKLFNISKFDEIKDPKTRVLLEQTELKKDKNGNYIKQGSFKRWFENGKIMIKGQNKLNERQGKWLYYHENGKLSGKSFYEKSQPVGNWKAWDMKNELIIDLQFKDGFCTTAIGNWKAEKSEHAFEIYEDGRFKEIYKNKSKDGKRFNIDKLYSVKLEWSNKNIKDEQYYISKFLNNQFTLFTKQGKEETFYKIQ